MIWPSVSLASAPMINDVTAKVTSETPIPSRVEQRMETTVSAIGAQLLAGRSIDDATKSRASDERIIHEVFDKVLVGYTVKRVAISVGEVTNITVELLPWADVIQSVDVDISVEGMPPLIESMVMRDLSSVDEVFADSLIGLPVAASDWTNGVIKRSLSEYLERHIPEFRGDFDVVPGQRARVKLVVYPRLPVVRSIDLSMRSSSIPNFTLLNHRDRMQENVNILIGVPVAFVERHQSELCDYLADSLDSLSDFHALRMHTRVTMPRIGEKMAVMSRSDTDAYLIRLEGWADIDRSQNHDKNLKFRIHAGRRLTSTDEIFAETEFSVENVEWDWWMGYTRRLTPTTRGIVRYDMQEKRFVLGGEQDITKKWMLRYEYRWADQKGEAAIRYRMHDFLSLEWAVDKDDNWLRVIGNF